MLSTDPHGAPLAKELGADRRRTRAMVQGWRPAARGLPLPTLGAAACLAAAPALIVMVRGGHDFGVALVSAALVLGATSGFVVDDPAEETISASPTSLARRRLLRLSAIALGVVVVAAVLLASTAVQGELTIHDVGRRAAELAAVSGVAASVAGAAHRRAISGAALAGALAGLLGTLLVSSLAFRFHSLPALRDGPQHARWWLVGVLGWSIAAWTWRDPAR